MLRELQRHFMRAVLDGGAAAGLLPAERVAIYANNARIAFTETLIRTYPAVLRLVGEPYFRQCAREYQTTHPSSSGDLQHVGERFPAYLTHRHGDDQFSYLADVARLEWAYQEALLEAEEAPMDVKRLAAVDPDRYSDLRLRLQDSARLVSSNFPIFASI
jgi:hypothetical protein